MLFRLSMTVALILATTANAETRKTLFLRGSWTLYQASDFQIRLYGKGIKFKKACIAETGGDSGKLLIAVITALFRSFRLSGPFATGGVR